MKLAVVMWLIVQQSITSVHLLRAMRDSAVSLAITITMPRILVMSFQCISMCKTLGSRRMQPLRPSIQVAVIHNQNLQM